MKRKNNGKDVLVDHSEAGSNIFPVRIMVVDSDEKSLQENVTILQKLPQLYKVTKCNKTDEAITWLEADGSEFEIILIGECLLAANKLKLLQIGNARDLAVLVTSADGGIDTIMRTLDDGACAYLPKPIPESVLERVWTYAYSKIKNKLSQVQKLTDDASGEKKPRLKWVGDLKKKVEESVIEAGGIKEAKPNDILERLRARGIQDNSITREKVSSYLQKERVRANNKNKEGTIEGSTLKNESNQPTGVQPSVDESLDDVFNNLAILEEEVILGDSSLPSNKSLPTGMSENCTEDDDIARDHSNYALDDLTMENISEMIQPHMPGYKNKEGTSSEHVESRYKMEEHPPMTLPHPNTTNPNQQGFNLPLPIKDNTSCTIGDQPFIPIGMLENCTEDDNIARDHSNYALDDLTMENISEMIQPHMPGYKNKEGTSSEHVESRYEMEEHPPMTLPHLNTTNPNQQGFNLPLPVEANTSCTIGDQPFIPTGMLENCTEDDNIARDHSNYALDDLTEKTSEMIQPHVPGYKDKEGTSSEHVESRYEMKEHPPMTLPHPNTTNPNQQGFNLPLPVEANTSCTIGDQPFIPTGMLENCAEDDDIARDHSNYALDDLTEKTSEMIQPHVPGYKDKEGTSSEHVESRYEMEEHPPMTLPQPNTTNPNQQGFNLSLPVEANTSCTIGDYQPFIDYWPENFFEAVEVDSIAVGGILEDPSLSDNPLVVNDSFSVDNYSVDDDLLMLQAAGLPEGESIG